jgi:hypothetical protein
MAGFQIETGTAHGRGFAGTDATGIMAKFYAWATKAYASGGPLWYIRDDFSANVHKDFATTDVNTVTGEITIAGHGFSIGHIVQFSTTGALPSGLSLSTSYYVIRTGVNTIKVAYNYTNAMLGTSIPLYDQGTGTHTITPYEFFVVVCDTASPNVNDYNTGPGGNAPKFLKVGYLTTEAAYIRVSGYLWWDNINHEGQGLWAGYRVATYDAADFAYDVRGGAEQMIIQARLGTAWSHVMIDDFTGDTNFLEAANKVGVLQSGVTAGSSVVLPLASGQELNFTVNKYYYIYDFNRHTWVDYFKVTSVDTGAHTITGDAIGKNFPSGAVISPYTHRYYMYGSNGGDGYSTWSYELCTIGLQVIPYFSSIDKNYIVHNQGGFICGAVSFSCMSTLINTAIPNDEGFYACQKASISEYARANDGSYYTYKTSMNRPYGVAKNLYETYISSMAQMLDYRTINGSDWLYLKLSPADNNIIFLCLNTPATS